MRALLLAALCAVSLFSSAADPADSVQLAAEQARLVDSIESTLHYKTGTFTLSNGIARITVAKGFKFLEAAEAKYVLEDLWGNLKGQEPLGMIFPETSTATQPEFAFIVNYEPMGYVKDGDAGDINYDDLLEELKNDNAAANEERRKAGIESIHLVGWAAKPYYDADRKILHWAKELKVEGYEEHTLNYDVRVLGRKGVLVLQAVSDIGVLPSVNRNINNILGMVTFSEGNRYADFDSNTDEVAAWTIGGLVAGKVLAKAGFFAVIMKFLKFILIGVAALGGAIVKYFRGRKKKDEEEPEYATEPAAAAEPAAEEQAG